MPAVHGFGDLPEKYIKRRHSAGPFSVAQLKWGPGDICEAICKPTLAPAYVSVNGGEGKAIEHRAMEQYRKTAWFPL